METSMKEDGKMRRGMVMELSLG